MLVKLIQNETENQIKASVVQISEYIEKRKQILKEDLKELDSQLVEFINHSDRMIMNIADQTYDAIIVDNVQVSDGLLTEVIDLKNAMYQLVVYSSVILSSFNNNDDEVKPKKLIRDIEPIKKFTKEQIADGIKQGKTIRELKFELHKIFERYSKDLRLQQVNLHERLYVRILKNIQRNIYKRTIRYMEQYDFDLCFENVMDFKINNFKYSLSEEVEFMIIDEFILLVKIIDQNREISNEDLASLRGFASEYAYHLKSLALNQFDRELTRSKK